MISTLQCEGMETRSGLALPSLPSEKDKSGHVMRCRLLAGRRICFNVSQGSKSVPPPCLLHTCYCQLQTQLSIGVSSGRRFRRMDQSLLSSDEMVKWMGLDQLKIKKKHVSCYVVNPSQSKSKITSQLFLQRLLINLPNFVGDDTLKY